MNKIDEELIVLKNNSMTDINEKKFKRYVITVYNTDTGRYGFETVKESRIMEAFKHTKQYSLQSQIVKVQYFDNKTTYLEFKSKIQNINNMISGERSKLK